MELGDKVYENWNLNKGLKDILSPYEKKFVEIELGREIGYYLNRLRGIGFESKNKVLDVACGIGQWTVALSKLNNFVEGIDISVGRLAIALELAKSLNVKNIHFSWANMEVLPFESNSFDAVFCYGALMFGDIPKTLSEFFRVLRPNGRLYTNINSYGWYLHLLLERAFPEKNIRLAYETFRMISRLLLCKKGNVPVSSKRINLWLKNAGFNVIYMGPDGSYGAKLHMQPPIYPPKHYGLAGVIEILAEKE